ncbi:MAG: beta-galactosidase [Bacteroidales bacterium]
MKRSCLFIFALVFSMISLFSQKVYKADASRVMEQPVTGKLIMGNPGPEGKQILVNSLYLTIAGRPVLPVMGEMHFSRIRRDQWEDCILKMQACGINIISTYLFWNQHEEVEGEFNWEGEKDLRSFVKLCESHGMYVMVRLGPWSHGEARNGGTPDWILAKKYIKERSNDIVYQSYVRRYFAQIASQLKGLYYKDGGNVIGVQLENEYCHGKEGEAHIQWLKDTAKSLGIDVPLYTVTGWGDGSVPPFEVIPMWGAYPDAPWDQTLGKIYQPENFEFDSFRVNKNTGNDQPKKNESYMSYENYPYFNCEVGVGNQNTYHRRVVISSVDGLGMMIAKLGSGSNMLGYYMFAGGTQFRGLLNSTEEEQEETGNWTRVPLKSYDFQAAIMESGEISPAYREVKKLHYFVNETAAELAPMMPVIVPSGKDDMQVAVRSDNKSGFLFGINYARYIPKETRKNCRFQVKFENETITFPQKGIDIPDSAMFIWPMNYNLDGLELKYSTVQLLGKVDNCYLFFQNRDIPAELAFDPSSLEKLTSANGTVKVRDNMEIVSGLNPGRQCIITAQLKNGKKLKIIVLSGRDANNCWILDVDGKKECFICEAGLYADHGNIFIWSALPKMTASKLNPGEDTHFSDIIINAPEKNVSVKISPHPLFADASWLESANFDSIPSYKERYHRFFLKEFSLGNPSRFMKATLYIYPEADCQVNLNNTFIRQNVLPGQLNEIDLTGYISKGENIMFLDFPFTRGVKKFAARVVVEYYNYDRIEFCTDPSWLFTDMYTNPVSFKLSENLSAAKTTTPPSAIDKINSVEFSEWDISVPYGTLDDFDNVCLKIKYNGDRAELYNGSRLAADNFNDNRTWSIGLNRLESDPEGRTLRLLVYKLVPNTKIFFDIPPSGDAYNSSIVNFAAKPQYKMNLEKTIK